MQNSCCGVKGLESDLSVFHPYRSSWLHLPGIQNRTSTLTSISCSAFQSASAESASVRSGWPLSLQTGSSISFNSVHMSNLKNSKKKKKHICVRSCVNLALVNIRYIFHPALLWVHLCSGRRPNYIYLTGNVNPGRRTMPGRFELWSYRWQCSWWSAEPSSRLVLVSFTG